MKKDKIFNILINVLNFALILFILNKFTINLVEKSNIFYYIQIYSLIGIFITFNIGKKFNWEISLDSFFILLIANLMHQLILYKNLSLFEIAFYCIFYYFLYEFTFYKIEDYKKEISLNEYLYDNKRILNIIIYILILSGFILKVTNISYKIFYDDIVFLYVLMTASIALIIFYVNKFKFKYK